MSAPSMDAVLLIITSCSILSWCPVDAKCLSNENCTPHGICLHGSCYCRSPWGGPACATLVLVDSSANDESARAAEAVVPADVRHSVQTALAVHSSSSPSKPLAMMSNMSGVMIHSGKASQNLAEENLRLQAEVKDLNQEFNHLTSQIRSMSSTISNHKQDGTMDDSVHLPKDLMTSIAGEAALMNGVEDSPPKHIKREVDWEVQHSRMAAIHVMLILGTVCIVLFLVYVSETARNIVDSVLGGEEPWDLMRNGEERPSPNIYRAVAILRPKEIGWLQMFIFIAQAVLCIVMQLYIPVTLLYENLVTFQMHGMKDYSTMTVSWWIGMIIRVVGLFNLARIFTVDTIKEMMDEYKDDHIILSMRRVRSTDRKKNDILIQFVHDLRHESPTRRIAAAIMLRRAAKPGVQILTSSDPEKAETVNLIDALCARLGSQQDEDEDGNLVTHPAEPDVMARCSMCHALGFLAGPTDGNVDQVLRNTLDGEENKEVKRHAEDALENIRNNNPDPEDDEFLAAWRAWEVMWISLSLVVTVVVATFLQVVVLIKMMVLTGSIEEVALIIMAVFFVNDLDEKVMKGQPLIKKYYWVQVYQHNKKLRHQPLWVKHITADGAVPLAHIILYVGLGLMVTMSWKNKFTGEIIQ